MPIPTRGFARILAYVLLVSVASRAAALREHGGHGHRRHGGSPAVPVAVPVAVPASLPTGAAS